MQRIEGVADALKVAAVTSEVICVTVRDAGKFVHLALGGCPFPAQLTVEQARHIAQALTAAADRAERSAKHG